MSARINQQNSVQRHAVCTV